MRRILPALLGFTLLIFTIALYFNWSKNASAAQATHLVISEIQVAGADPDEDFIELYNPTSSEVNLGDLRLVKRTSSGTVDTDIVVFSASDTIPAHGFYLWCNTALSGSLTCDKISADTVSNNNSVGLRNEPADTGALVDAVTFGTVTNSLGEGSSLIAPAASSSVERKANSLSDATSMGSGGVDEFAGNGEDTDNNTSDFVSRLASQPQNSQSAIELPVGPTPTLSPTPTIEPSVTPTLTPSPSPTPSVEPSPTTTPTSSPTPTLSPIPTVVPSVSPTLSPAPPTPTPKIIARGPIFTCTLNYKPWRFFGKTFFFPFIHCARTT